MNTPCVVHLVRAKNGPDVFRRFLSSYVAHDAGLPHRLLIAFKGFKGAETLAPYDALLRGIPHDRLFVRDFGFDIRSYVVAVRRSHFGHYCFLNSFSVILAGDWLAKLAFHAGGKEPALVGATGSWTSHISIASLDRHLGKFLVLNGRKIPLPPGLSQIAKRKWLWSLRRAFDAFPNPHIRTNCFLTPRDLLLECAPGRLLQKFNAYCFESGKSGLSHAFKAAGRKLLVVGRDGNAYAEDRWPESRTFWRGDQENLLVSDNQTASYQTADAATRTYLTNVAWVDPRQYMSALQGTE
jgi:hypothetical protein